MASSFDTPLFTSDQSIDRVLNAGLPVVLVVLEGPARAGLEQAMNTLAKREAGQLLVVQVHAKDSPETLRRFAIHNLPAVVTLKNNQVQSQAENITSEELERHASFLLGKGPKPEPQVRQPAAAGAYAGGPPAGAYGAQPQRTASTAGANEQGGQPVTVTDATFDQDVMRSPIPVVVDFWAPWCGPCRMVAPTLEKLAREWNGKVKIAKVNVDENPMIAGRFGVTGIPTMMVVRNGQIADRWSGALPEAPMRTRLSTVLK